MVEFGPFDSSQTDAVVAVFRQAFADAEGAEEGGAIAALVENIIADLAQVQAQGFVAADEGVPIAGIFFTPLCFDNAPRVMLLSPVAVTTARQGERIGDGLIRSGLDALTEQGVDVAVTYGDPNYYGRFGFAQVSPEVIEPPHPLAQPHGWQALPLKDQSLPRLRGRARCIAAFDAPGLW